MSKRSKPVVPRGWGRDEWFEYLRRGRRTADRHALLRGVHVGNPKEGKAGRMHGWNPDDSNH